MFKKETRYATRGINAIVDVRLQLIMWNLIDQLKKKKEVYYLQIFRISKEENKRIIIEHEQEVQQYKEKYVAELEGIEITGVIKIYVIDRVEYSTMILASEY